MSPALDINGTFKPPLDDYQRLGRTFEVRSATDITTPIELLVELEGQSWRSATASVTRDGVAGMYGLTAPLEDPWLLDTIINLASFRNVRDGWDGDEAPAPNRGSLDTAEMLAVFFAARPAASLPQVSVDAMGRPTFALNSGGFYLHLTVDEPGKLTWFAEVNGTEFYEADVPFNGRALPSELSNILPARDA